MDPLFIGIVGSKNTGKSNFTLKLSDFLINLGLKIVIIKYSHSRYSIEPKSKDSALFHGSKAEGVIFSSPFETVIYQKNTKKNRVSLDQIMAYFSDDVDVVLCESYPRKLIDIPFIFIIKAITDFEETKNRFRNIRPLFVSGPYAEQHQGDLEGTPLLSFNRPEDLPLISRIISKLRLAT